MNTYYGNNTGIEKHGANTGHGNYVGHPAWSKISGGFRNFFQGVPQ